MKNFKFIFFSILIIGGLIGLSSCAGVFEKTIEGSWAIKNIQGWGEEVLPMAGEVIDFKDGNIISSNIVINFLIGLLVDEEIRNVSVKYKNDNNRNMIIYIDPIEMFNLEIKVVFEDRNRIIRLEYGNAYIELMKNIDKKARN